MATVSGNTYDHREYLKTVASWDKARKVWTLPDSATDYIAAIRALTGCVVTMARVETPATPRDPNPAPKKIGKTIVAGNDQSYLNAFAHQNPPFFAGFASWSDWIDFVENVTPDNDHRSGNIAWSNDRSWTGTRGMNEALDFARNGWSAGVEKAKEAAAIIEADHVTTRQRAYSVAGGRVNVGKMLTSNPVHMSKRERQPARKVVTLFCETFVSAAVSAENNIIRAAAIAAMSDILENAGYSCEIVAICHTSKDAQNANVPGFQVACKIKNAGDTLNINDVTFALGHPSVFRRMVFATVISDVRNRSLWTAMGYPKKAFDADHPTEPGQIYIRNLSMDDEPKVDRAFTFADKVRAMFPLIVPDNFPVTLK